MPTTNVILESTYKLITEEAAFTAANSSSGMQEWLWADALPVETLLGAPIPSGKGMNESHGSGKLYGRGGGLVVIFT